jgi:integrase
VKAVCTEWVNNHKLSSLRAKSNERSLLRQLVHVKLNAITLDDLKAYQVRRGELEGKSNRTVNLELRILIRVLKEQNLWKRSLKEHYRPLPESESDLGKALTVEQLAKLEQTARSNDRWLIAYLAEILSANSGMRAGEIRKTRMGAVDLENSSIISAAKQPRRTKALASFNSTLLHAKR